MSLQPLREVPGTGETQEDDDEVEARLLDTSEIREAIREAFIEMAEIDNERDDINAKANEIRARMKNKGIPTAALNAAYKRYKMDEDKRESHDFAFALCCNSVGAGYQPGLFDDKPAKTTH